MMMMMSLNRRFTDEHNEQRRADDFHPDLRHSDVGVEFLLLNAAMSSTDVVANYDSSKQPQTLRCKCATLSAELSLSVHYALTSPVVTSSVNFTASRPLHADETSTFFATNCSTERLHSNRGETAAVVAAADSNSWHDINLLLHQRQSS